LILNFFMKKIMWPALLLFSLSLFAQQDEKKFCEQFLVSVQKKDFSLLKEWLGPNSKSIQEKWQKLVANAHRDGFKISGIKIKEIVTGKQIPGLPVKSIIAVYEYEGKEWDDLLLMVTTDKKIKLAEIPLTSYMFMLDEERRGKNIADAKKE